MCPVRHTIGLIALTSGCNALLGIDEVRREDAGGGGENSAQTASSGSGAGSGASNGTGGAGTSGDPSVGSGGQLPETCGDGTLDAGEVCIPGTPAQTMVVDPSHDPLSLVTLDADGDTDVDFAVGHDGPGGVRLVENVGSGMLSTMPSAVVGGPHTVRALTALDLGATDGLALIDPDTETAHVLERTGAFTFADFGTQPVLLAALPRDLVALDFDGATGDDVFITVGGDLCRLDADYDGCVLETTNADLTVMAAGDVNGDGIGDLVYADSDGSDEVYVRFGNDAAPTVNLVLDGISQIDALATGDLVDSLTGDEIAIVGNDRITVIGYQSGALAQQIADPLFVADDVVAVALGRVDGDAHLDAVTAQRNDQSIAVLLGNGEGVLAVAATLAVGSAVYDLALLPLNGDGALDVVALVDDGDSSLAVLLADP